MDDTETCDCELCVDLRYAMNLRGITNPRERQLVRQLVQLQAEMCDVMCDAEEEGFDLTRPTVNAVMDDIFNDEEKPTCH